MVLAVVAVVVIASLGVGAGLWAFKSRDSKSGPTATASGPSASPLPDAPAPLGALRPPRDIQMASLEQPISDPKWSYRTDARPELLGGDSHTTVAGLEDVGLIALDTASGTPRWPGPVSPADVDLKKFNHGNCVIDRAATTIGCALSTGDDLEEVLIFLDTATGAEKHHEIAAGNVGADLYSAGDGFVATTDGELVGYRSDGTEIWRADNRINGGVDVYGDQAVIIVAVTGGPGRVLDANSGRTLVHAPVVDSSTAFASGFALSDGAAIDFYDFTGAKTASTAADGFRLIDNDQHFTASSGTYYPVSFNPSRGGLRAYDPATGATLWSVGMVSPSQTAKVVGFGSGKTCFIGLLDDRDERSVTLSTQECGISSTNVYLSMSADFREQIGTWIQGYDGERVLVDAGKTTHLVRCVDVASGQEVWEGRTNDMIGAQWLGNGLFSASTGGLQGVHRWA
ncbi:PQQ-binding-like beta-propeller repeat protein [Mycolicibacterium farcinogenes]|nr:PQQ-binding-like beta-propeller repeat protein [Mycolicibacterium farcinogenes]